MTLKNKNSQDKEIRERILSMIVPITIENVLQMTVGFVSMAMIGRISPIAVGSLGISNRLVYIVWDLFKGIAVGGSVFVAQTYGAHNFKKLKKVAYQALISSIILVLIFQQILFWKGENLLKIFNPSDALLENATMYLRTVSWGLPFIVIVLIVAGILQGMGDAKIPMKIALIMNIFNVIFSYIFIFGNLGFKALGLKGAAIATVLSQIIAAIIGLWVLFGKTGVLTTMDGETSKKLDFKVITSVYKVGLPTSFEAIFWQFAAILITKAILTYGEIAFAAYQLGLQAEAISYMPAAGFGVAATTFVGQALGGGERELGKKYLKQLTKWTTMITIITSGLLIFFPRQIMRILTDDVEVIEIGIKYLFVMGLVQIPQSVSGVLNGALRGAGFTKVPMLVAGVGLWGIRVPLSLLMAYIFKKEIWTIWIVIGVDLICRFILSYTIYKKKDIYNRELLIDEDD